MSDSFWNEIYDPQGMRVQGHTPGRWIRCSECMQFGGHKYTCSKATKEELARLVANAQKHEKWARERAEKMLNAVQRTHGKLAMIKHENNKLRRANERLRRANERLRALVSDFLQAIAAVPMRAVDCDQETVRKLEKQLRAELARQTPSPADEKTK